MPRVDRGWLLYLPATVSRAETLSWSAACGCIIVSEPFNTIVEVRGERLPLSIPPGSILCPPGCNAPSDPDATLAEPAWARGATAREAPCPFYGPRDALAELRMLTGVELLDASAETVLREGGVAVAKPGLEFEPHENVCGLLKPMLPTHPAAALTPSSEACLEKLYEPVRGSRWWGGVPVVALRVERRQLLVVQKYGVLAGDRPEAILLSAWPPGPLRAAYAATVLYACGVRD